MLPYILNNLEEIVGMITKLDDRSYRLKLEVLSGSSIGAHVRHILEFYLCLFNSKDATVVCYDDRKRDGRIETDKFFALETVEEIKSFLNKIVLDKTLLLKSNMSTLENKELFLETSVFRELAYAFEHSVHHQALIKIGIRELGFEHVLGKTFGIAPSTIRYELQINGQVACRFKNKHL